jgi:hypothetical protein
MGPPLPDGGCATWTRIEGLDMLKDIREISDEQYWEELRSRWTSLLSYRYIGRNHGGLNTGPVDNTVTLRHDMRNAAGGIMVAPLCISAPESGGFSDSFAVPNPVIQSMQILDDARGVCRIEVVRSEVLKRGRQLGFSRSTIIDADNPQRVIAFAEGAGVSLGDVPGGFEQMEEEKIVVIDSPDLPPLHKVFGAHKRDDGNWVLGELTIETASPDAALHLGPQHILLEAAATDLAADLVGTDRLQVQSWHVMFLARGKVGPFRVDGEAVYSEAGRIGVRMTVHDEGNDDRAITSGSAVFSQVEYTTS